MEDREKNSKKTEKKFLLFKEKVWQTVTMQNESLFQPPPALCTTNVDLMAQEKVYLPIRLVLILYRNGLMRA